jgi:hypothetical protein
MDAERRAHPELTADSPALCPQKSEIAGTVKELNDLVTNKLRQPSLQRFVKQYNLGIRSAQLAMKSGDLTLVVTLSGQMPIAEADRRLSSLLLNGSR